MGQYFWFSLSAFILILSICLSICIKSQAWAYVPTLSANGIPVRWKKPVKLNLVGNPSNQSGLMPTDVFNAVVKSLQRWKFASSNAVNFDYWQGTDPQSFPANSTFNGVSSIYFVSQSTTPLELPNNVLGMTQVWYNTENGEIFETDIALNDTDFHFTNNPTDTSGFGSVSSTSSTQADGKSDVYIQNVITHELGHALGLSHSGGLQSTMLFTESPEQAHLGCDEMIAIHALYPTSDATLRGDLSGTVLSETGTPIFGAHVVAISQRRGTVLATALTDPSGHYSIHALETGHYFLMAEPFYAGPQALPIYYSKSNSSICSNNSPFMRGFLTENDSFTLFNTSVTASHMSIAPNLIVHCNNNPTPEETTFSTNTVPIPVAHTINTNTNSFGTLDRISKTNTNYYRLPGISGHVEIHAMSYSLYSPLHPSLSLLTPNGSSVDTEVFDPIYRGDSGYINYDSAITAEELPYGDYLLKVSFTRLQANNYPGGPVSLDSLPFLLLTGSINEEKPTLSALIPTNGRCRTPEIFEPYSSPSGMPIHSPNQPESKGMGSCGAVQYKPPNEAHQNSSSSTSNRIGWLLPWLLMGFAGRAAIRLHGNSHTVTLK